MRTIHSNIVEYIRESGSILITSHEDPDGDSIGSQLALYRYINSLNKNVAIVDQGAISGKYKFLPNIDLIGKIEEYSGEKHFDLAIILECPELERVGRVADLIRKGMKLINIDHHPDNTGFGDVTLIDSRAAAVGEILTEFFLDISFRIDEETASLLYAAILTDTGRFRFDSTTRRTMEIAGQLVEFGANPRKICDNIYYSLTESTLRLTGTLFSQAGLFENGRICLISLDKKMLRDNCFDMADTDGMAEYTLYCKDVLVGGFLREIDGKATKVSLRSRDSINVSRLAHKYGGGGHFNASGYSVGLPIEVARERLLDDLKELVSDTI